MHTLLSNLVNFLHAATARIFSDPAHATKVITTGFLIVGISTMTLDAANLSANLLRSSITDAATKKIVAEEQMHSAAAFGAAKACGVSASAADKLITNFQKSFSGVLPGFSDVLKSKSATVVERKAKLIDAILKRYMNYKYCIAVSEYEQYRDENQANLGTYLIAKYGTSTVLPSVAAKEDDLIRTDFHAKQTFVTEVIESAIANTSSTDQQISDEGTNLQNAETAAQLDKLTGLIKVSNAIDDKHTAMMASVAELLRTQTEIAQDSSILLDKIANIKAYEHRKDTEAVFASGWDDKYFNEKSESVANTARPAGYGEIPLPNRGNEVVVTEVPEEGLASVFEATKIDIERTGAINVQDNNTTADAPFAFGLLTLVKPDDAREFLETEFQEAVLRYVAITNGKNPDKAGGGLSENKDAVPLPPDSVIEAQTCKALDNGGTCFGIS